MTAEELDELQRHLRKAYLDLSESDKLRFGDVLVNLELLLDANGGVALLAIQALMLRQARIFLESEGSGAMGSYGYGNKSKL